MRRKKRSYEGQRHFDQQQEYDYIHTRQYKLKRLIRHEIRKESDA